jgi:hypothetical protein
MGMKVTFEEQGHVYKSMPALSWTSVTTLVKTFIEEFDAAKQAAMSSRSHKSKWFGIKPHKIIQIWDNENERSTRIGSIHHGKMEGLAIKRREKVHRGKLIKVFPSIVENSIKIARDQCLDDGIYPEHLIHSELYGVAGQSDLVYVADGYVDIDDYKTNKEIVENSFGFPHNPRMMLPPVNNLMDCNYWHYALQLSIYMKLILLKNPHLKPGVLRMIHFTFEVERRDQYGFPTIKIKNGYPVVEKSTIYMLPYLEKEAILVLKTLIV